MGAKICFVLGRQPPYALAPTYFRFPALAALAGRAPIGGQREVALAAYMVARLAHDLLPDRELPQPVRAERGTSAKAWLSTLSLPAAVRTPIARVIDSTVIDRRETYDALRPVMVVTAPYLTQRARLELEELARALAGGAGNSTANA